MLKITYIKSCKYLDQLPNDDIKEIAIVGRSNVGKSTLINSIANNKKLSKISSSPGKTRLMNLFDYEGRFRLVDLPGYGFARMSKGLQNEISFMINTYLTKRTNIDKIIILIDMRRGVMDIDKEFISFVIENNISFSIVGTKLDKCNQSQRHTFKKNIKELFGISVINYSSLSKKGVDELKILFNSF